MSSIFWWFLQAKIFVFDHLNLHILGKWGPTSALFSSTSSGISDIGTDVASGADSQFKAVPTKSADRLAVMNRIFHSLAGQTKAAGQSTHAAYA